MYCSLEFRSDRKFDVVGFGTNAVDFLISVPKYPEFSSKIELIDYVQAAGGEVATTMVGLQRLGLKTAYIGRFGNDDAGKIGSLSLTNEGVDISASEFVNGASTQIAFIIIDEVTGERTVIWKRDAKLSFSHEDAPLAMVRRAKILHLTPHDVEACIAMATEARAAGTIVSIDIDNLFNGVEGLLPLVDILIASSDLPTKLTGNADQADALVQIRDTYGCSIVGVTLGESGSLLYSDGTFVRSDGFAVPGGCKDTTGAGDSFRVGLLFGLLNGSDVAESARFANAVAALKCRAVGARTALPSRKELLSFVSEKV